MTPPPKWKTAIVVWLAIYPLLTGVLYFFGTYMNRIEILPLRTFVTTVILVPIMVFILIPFIQKVLAGWLTKQK